MARESDEGFATTGGGGGNWFNPGWNGGVAPPVPLSPGAPSPVPPPPGRGPVPPSPDPAVLPPVPLSSGAPTYVPPPPGVAPISGGPGAPPMGPVTRANVPTSLVRGEPAAGAGKAGTPTSFPMSAVGEHFGFGEDHLRKLYAVLHGAYGGG